mmetsp:Transcript_41233/g.94858  ORF Transcript_41233/g.94858 Transcript_41233/m.94858 type:complete len:255 (+) Transcript_41233:556-1320(+)
MAVLRHICNHGMPVRYTKHLKELDVVMPTVVSHFLPAQRTIFVRVNRIEQCRITSFPVQIHMGEVRKELVSADPAIMVRIDFFDEILPSTNPHLDTCSFILTSDIVTKLIESHDAIPISVYLIENLTKPPLQTQPLLLHRVDCRGGQEARSAFRGGFGYVRRSALLALLRARRIRLHGCSCWRIYGKSDSCPFRCRSWLGMRRFGRWLSLRPFGSWLSLHPFGSWLRLGRFGRRCKNWSAWVLLRRSRWSSVSF